MSASPVGVATEQPRVTIVMSFRERHALAEGAIESIVAETPVPYRFLYLDIQSPPWLRALLAERAAQWNLEVVRFDEPLWPQEARQRIIDRIGTEYTVFIDNDVQVEPGWLEALLACAEETGAGIVGPLYLWGDGIGEARIHMAGGRLTETVEGGARVLEEAHHLINADPREVARELVRRPCGFVEYHCMLARTELLRSPAFIDPRLRAVHEHIDASLACRARGLPVMFEPAARVQYLAFADHMLEDLDAFRRRWSREEAEANIAHFCRKWNVIGDERSFGGLRDFVRDHRDRVDPLCAGAPWPERRAAAMQPVELAQNRSGLLDRALAAGYDTDAVASVDNAFRLAQRLADGGYRPCGRPFLDHLVGTASVLVHYGFRVEIIAAGLLHAAYSHAPPHPAGPAAQAAAICALLGGADTAIEKRVRAYTLREALWDLVLATPDGVSTLSILEAEIIAMDAANDADMFLSGEVRYSGRADTLGQDKLAVVAEVCRRMGVPGLFLTLVAANRQRAPAPESLLTHQHGSYRIGPDGRTRIAMVRGLPVTPEQDRALIA